MPLCAAVCKQERHCLSCSLSGVCRECVYMGAGVRGFFLEMHRAAFGGRALRWGEGCRGEPSFCFSRASSSPHGLLSLFQQRDAKTPLSTPSCTLGLGSQDPPKV